MNRARKNLRAHRRRRSRAFRDADRRVYLRMRALLPPPQGSRRPAFSSSTPGKWEAR